MFFKIPNAVSSFRLKTSAYSVKKAVIALFTATIQEFIDTIKLCI